jgi:multidrug efflux pump subunit AcrB
MWIVELALKRPHTFIVLALTIAMFGILSIVRMPVDIFPTIDVPVVSCVWTYQGMSPYNMENLVTTVCERALTSTINGIKYMESTSLSGMSIVKLYLQKGTEIGEAVAMTEAVGTAILRQLPRGISPPFVTASSATDVPVIQLGLSSDTLNEAQLFDIANNFVRSQLATIQGTTVPFPYGGKYRQVSIDLDPDALVAFGLSANDVMNAVKNQSVVYPCGTAKMGPFEYIVIMNNIPATIEELNALPIKAANGAVIFVRDLAHVHDGNQPQLNIVNHNGKRSVLFNILKSGNASTLSVVQRVKALLPHIRSIVPPSCKIQILTDQSTFVRECVFEVVREAITAATLTAFMMLVLLGSWRSTLIVASSIPLAMLASIIGLNICGQTINSMTLGGLALAVGMLVDDATVAVENLHVNLSMGKDIERAILDGAEQVALPALVSTLSICIVFVPVLFLTEPARSLFIPLGMAVVFAMLASYGLSRTIVPLMSKALLSSEVRNADIQPHLNQPGNIIARTFASVHDFVEHYFELAREQYQHALEWVLEHRRPAVLMFLGFYALSFCLTWTIGADFFPTIDAGQLRLHVNAPAGTRIEQTERIFHRIENAITKSLGKDLVESMTDNIGLPISGVNYAYSDSQTISEADGEILINLSEHKSQPTTYYQKQIRRLIAHDFPEVKCYFQPADIVTQILNAGLPAPIDVKVLGMNREKNIETAQKLKHQIQQIEGAADVCLHQASSAPHFRFDVDRIRAEQVGLSQEDVSNSLNISLTSSFQTNPNFWINQKNGISYNLAVQTPQYQYRSIDDLRNMTVTSGIFAKTKYKSTGQAQPTASPNVVSTSQSAQFATPELLTNLASFSRVPTPTVINHFDVLPEYDIFAACQDRDLNGVSQKVIQIVSETRKTLPQGTFVFTAGQVKSMLEAFIGLISGLAFALVLVYLLLVVNFQSWTDPLIILMAVPGAFSGIIWSLFVTHTSFSIPALMGTIMTVGVASANSILMITFANDELLKGCDPKTAALNAGFQRFRPVIMTATAMIIGMIPMAIGAGQGGSQNAPIGRAVIGGLTVATFSTLLFVPLIFSLFREKWKSSAQAGSSKISDGGSK